MNIDMKTLEVVAAIIEHKGQILLAQRPQTSDQPGLWEFPGGKVEVGESQPEALARELHEELGISAIIGGYVASHRQPVNQRIIHLHAWHVPCYQGTLHAFSHSQLAWCYPQAAFEYALAPADIPLLIAFIAQRAAR